MKRGMGEDAMRAWALGFGATVLSLGLIVLYSLLERWHSAHVARTFRLANVLPLLRLLLILPGILMAWGVRDTSPRRLRFSPAPFLAYALLPLCLALYPLVLTVLLRLGMRAPAFVLRVSGLQPIWALMAGWGLGFSFRTRRPS